MPKASKFPLLRVTVTCGQGRTRGEQGRRMRRVKLKEAQNGNGRREVRGRGQREVLRHGRRGREGRGEIGVPHSPKLLLDHIKRIGQRSLFGSIDASCQNKETMSSYCCMPGLVKCGMSITK